MSHNKITVTHLTPAMGQILVGGATTQFPTLHHAFFVGDLLTKKDCRRLQDLAPNVRIVNMYGTTETQRAVSYFELPAKAETPNFLDSMPDVIPVGQGMLDVQLLVVDREDRNRICDVGEQGELFLRAGGLAEGYLGDDDTTVELNRSKFISNWYVEDTKWIDVQGKASSQPWMKFYKGPRDRLYRTGDLGHYRSDGFVECTGRIDNQVKIRGFRIELGDIDSNLSHHPFVRENVTTIRRNKDEEPTLVSYIVPEAKRWLEAQSTPATSEIDPDLGPFDESMVVMINRYKALSESCKDFLRGRLPTYAIPAIIIPLARMPLNPNGKIDKPSLPFPDETDLSSLGRRLSKHSSSLSETQSTLATIWASVLPNISARMLGTGSNFFDEGGHSVLAQQMLFKVRKEWASIDIPMSIIFQSQTLGSFAAEIDRALDPTGLRLDSVPLSGQDVQDEAYAADARDLLNSLPAQFTPSLTLDIAEPLVVFLTGATGFLGSYILRELFTKTKARVIAHVRCSDPADGLSRIERTCRAYGFWDSSWRDDGNPRLEVVRGDISHERLGLEPADWLRLEESVDLVVHNGAQVNWMLPYSSLRAANVMSTVDCVQLCGRAKPKRLVFISSTSTLDNDHYVQLSQDICKSGGTGINEVDDLEGSRRGLTTGYGQTKWSSEYIIRQAGTRGLHGTIVRSGYVTGEPETGITITDDFLVRMWKGCLQVRCRPDISNTLNQVPVTQVARLAVAAGFYSPITPTCVAHVTSHPRLTMNSWLGALEVYGYDVPQVSYQEWVGALKGYVGDTESLEVHSLLPLFDMVTNNLPTSSIAPELDDSNSTAILQHFGDSIQENAVTEDHIGRYLAYLVSIGFLPPPRGKRGRPLPHCPIPLTDLTMLGGRGATGR
jgi:L-aminoadipate-semialdehyde dehydrogenase